MKKFIALFLALLCVFCFVGCNNSDNNENNTTETLTDYEKIARYVANNNGSVTIEDDNFGTVTIANPGKIIRIKCENHYGDILIYTQLDLKESEEYFNYEGTYSYGTTTFTINGTIEADVYDAWTTLTYNTTSGSGYISSISIRSINNTMCNALNLARNIIAGKTSVDIYELYGFDALV